MVIDGLLKQGLDSTATQIAMWENMTIWNTAYQKLTSLYTAQDEMSRMIEKEKNNLVLSLKRKPLALEGILLKLICEHLSVNTSNVKSIGDLDDLGLDIEDKTIKLLRSLSKNKFQGKTINDLIHYSMHKMFDDLSAKFKEKDKRDQKDIVKKIIEIIDKMPDVQKEIMRNKLGVDTISQQAVSKAITTGALGVAFASVVEIAGFSAFTFAVQALAATAGLVGLTLPFAAYTTLTSIMAALANPLLIIPATVGLGYFMTKKGNHTIKNNLLPTVITHIAVSATKQGDTHKKSEQLVRRLKKLVSDSKQDDLYTKTKIWISNLKKGGNE